MTPTIRFPWFAVTAALALLLAYDLGAGTADGAAPPAATLDGAASMPISVQVDVRDTRGQVVYLVPEDAVFVLHDLYVTNTRDQAVDHGAGRHRFPSLVQRLGNRRTLALAGTNLRSFPTGSPPNPVGSPYGGGATGSTVGQAGLALHSGVVFAPGSEVLVQGYEGPLFFAGSLRRR